MSGSLRGSGDGDVRAALEAALVETRGAPADVAELSRRPFAYETSFAIDELDVVLGDGERLALLAKDVGPSGLSAEAAATKPNHTLDPGREIAVYRDLLRPQLGTPQFHGTAVDPEIGRWWLFLERIEGEVLTDVGELPLWCEAAAWAARLDAAVSGDSAALLHRDAAWHGHWIDAAAAALDAGPRRATAEALRAHRSLLVERLDALPRAFVHGELYPANVLVVRREGDPRIAPVDWELAGSGPYALDLAALASGWNRENRLAMCRAFHDALPAPRPQLDELLRATRLCGLALAVQWIGWSAGWRPPESQRHDWAREAADLLDELGMSRA